MTQQLITIESINENAIAVFTGESDALELLLVQIETEALAVVADVKTNKGRAEIRSNAANVAKAKVRIDDAGKLLVADLKDLPKKVDASRKAVRDRLDALRDRVRQPLTDWEAEQEAIEAAEKAKRLFLQDWDTAILENERFDFEAEKAALRAEQEAIEAKRLADEKAEVERLAIIQAEKDKAEREERIKQEAIEYEQLRQKVAKEKAESEKLAAEKMAALAIENARLEKIAAEQAAINMAKQTEERRLKAIEDARIAQELAIEKERKRIEDEAKAQKIIDDKRALDIEHRKSVNNAIKAKLIENGFSEADSIKIITLAVKGMLGNLKVIY